MRVSIEGGFTVINKTNRRSKMKYTGTFFFHARYEWLRLKLYNEVTDTYSLFNELDIKARVLFPSKCYYDQIFTSWFFRCIA